MRWRIFFQFLAIALILFFADAFLKGYVHFNLPVMQGGVPYPHGGIGVFQKWHGIDFSIVHVMNRGAAWGVFASFQDYLVYARMLIVFFLLLYLFVIRGGAYSKFSVTLIVTGAIGNVVDYFLYGHVVDMFYVNLWGYSYPVFNIADSAIFIGIALLMVQSLIKRSSLAALKKS